MQLNGDFTWETVLGDKNGKGKAEEKSQSDKKPDDEVKPKTKKSKKKTKGQNVLPSTMDDDDSKIVEKDESTEKEEPPFSFNDLRFEVPKGAFVAIVGRVGCGKVSREGTFPFFL